MAINAILWIRDPYPFRYDDMLSLEEALRMYSRNLTYVREWPVDYVSIDDTNITTCRQVASTLKAIHRMHAIQDKKTWGRSYCEQLDIEIRGASDGRPEWAKVERT